MHEACRRSPGGVASLPALNLATKQLPHARAPAKKHVILFLAAVLGGADELQVVRTPDHRRDAHTPSCLELAKVVPRYAHLVAELAGETPSRQHARGL